MRSVACEQLAGVGASGAVGTQASWLIRGSTPQEEEPCCGIGCCDDDDLVGARIFVAVAETLGCRSDGPSSGTGQQDVRVRTLSCSSGNQSCPQGKDGVIGQDFVGKQLRGSFVVPCDVPAVKRVLAAHVGNEGSNWHLATGPRGHRIRILIEDHRQGIDKPVMLIEERAVEKFEVHCPIRLLTFVEAARRGNSVGSSGSEGLKVPGDFGGAGSKVRNQLMDAPRAAGGELVRVSGGDGREERRCFGRGNCSHYANVEPGRFTEW